MSVAAIVLAAGASRRMGAINKLTIDIGGRPLVARAIEALAAGGAAPILVVTRDRDDELAAAIDGLAVERVGNPRSDAGVGASIAAGVRALGDRAPAALIAPGDMPRVDPRSVAALIDAHLARPALAFAPVYRGRRGHPVLFPAAAFPILATLDGDRGARDVFASLAHELIAVDDPGVLVDVDTPEQILEV